MIRSLFDVENMPEDEDKSGDEKIKAEFESAETERVAEEISNEPVAENTFDENIAEEKFEDNDAGSVIIKPISKEKPVIKHLPADEIISQLNKREEIAKETPQGSVANIESSNDEQKTFADDTFLELEEAAKKIESESQANIGNQFSIPFNEEADLEDEKLKRLESELVQIENELLEEKEAEKNLQPEKPSKKKTPVINSLFGDDDEIPVTENKEAENISFTGNTENNELVKSEVSPFETNMEPESKAEIFRKSGMAYSAAIALLAAVIFMMVIGWGADLLLNTSPWGIVVGIIIGAVIGFIQFFRVTSQIFKK